MRGINIKRVKTMVEQLMRFGLNDDGSITRLSYSEPFVKAQEYITGMMRQAGMEVQRDAIGNLIGTYPGIRADLPAVMTGSHLDTVPNGGKLDGALGIIAALECALSWQESGWRPVRPVKIIATVEEEGSTFGLGCLGSRSIIGELATQDFKQIKDKNGRILPDYLAAQDLASNNLSLTKIDLSTIHSFLELHIEQGEELDLNGKACALVTDIVGIDRHWLSIKGHANHAGTTRMDRRCDALVAAAELIKGIYEAALASNGGYVATVGKLIVSPGATNVVPGEVQFTIETRAADNKIIDNACETMMSLLTQTESKYKVKATVLNRHLTLPRHLDDNVLEVLRQAARKVAVEEFNEMPSWAGHDAKILAAVIPSGMIFVPSIAGISHSKDEQTNFDDIEQGIKILNQALITLACDTTDTKTV